MPRTAFGRWIRGGATEHASHADEHTYPWHRVLWLTGVDYFSTLGYQPGIALLAAGALSPVATAVLLAVTLFGAVPVYKEVAARSYAGQGSIAMLESLIPGWWGRVFVLVLLGFAATDFVITMTLSAADAGQHAAENPFLHPYIGDHQFAITIGLLALLAAVFLKGFREAIGVATFIAIPYLLLNVVVIGEGLAAIAANPALLEQWRWDLSARGDWGVILAAALMTFPKLALGLSGFETGVSVMPLVRGEPGDAAAHASGAPPLGRVRATRRMLTAAAIIMSVLLLSSSVVTTLLIPHAAVQHGGEASGRAIAYLAHERLGHGFGTVYDVATIVILWFAGASAMAGLLHLIPRYLPHFGMAPHWAARTRALVLVLLVACVVVTCIFRADVEAQAGAYATGVLVLMLSAATAVTLALWHERPRRLGRCIYFAIVTGVFLFTLGDNIVERTDGIIIASVFVFVILTIGAISRFFRATEMRVLDAVFEDEESARVWASIVGKKVSIVPLKTTSHDARRTKAAEIRAHYAVPGRLAFLHVDLVDNRSDFLAKIRVRAREEESGDVTIEARGAVAIANSIAYLSEVADPVSIFLGLTRESLMKQALRYIIWGEGETGLMVYTILIRYWDWTPEDDVRPLIFMMSE
ncbi:MAG: hypothetical protein ACKVU1_16975 [bacterium]